MSIITGLLLAAQWNPRARLMLELMRMMFPYMLLACVGAVFIGILNARGHFFIPAIGAAVLNVVMIASVLFLAPLMGKTPRYAGFSRWRSESFIAGALPADAFSKCRLCAAKDFRYRWVSPWRRSNCSRKSCIK